MKISLFLNDKIYDFRLPSEVSGSYRFDATDDENTLINVEARNGKWVLYQTADVNVAYNNAIVDSVELSDNEYYILQKDNVNYLIYVTELKLANMLTYTYNSASLNFTIGNKDGNGIRYNCPYINDLQITISLKNNNLILSKVGNSNIYINKLSLRNSQYYIKNGDQLEIFGLRIQFLNNLLLVSNLPSIDININNTGLVLYTYPALDEPQNIEIKDVELYDKDDYFSKKPRLRRIIETKKIKLSTPPRDGNNDEMPLILTIGPMLTMGAMSSMTVINTVNRIKSGKTTLQDSLPQLVTAGVMLISMLVWPLVTQAYNKHRKKKKRQEIIEKYSKYLNEKREELSKEANLQKIILFENLISIDQCIDIIKHRGFNFWDKRSDQSDFLVMRIGVGNEKLDAEIEYPDEGFTIEEDELKNKADELVAQFKYIENVPIGYSFHENRTVAIMGTTHKTTNFIHNIILQAITFYSYEDLKIVVFTNESRKKNWDYIKYLNHAFNNDKSFRFFATDFDSTKNVAEYMDFEITNRLNQLNGNHGNTTTKPHYMIIVDDYDAIKHYDFANLITETEDDLGFNMIINESRLSKLPSKCNNFITIGENKSNLLQNSYEKQEQVTFTDEINYNIDMMGVARILSNIPIEFEESVGALPESISFLEMEKVGKVEQLNILNRWSTNDSTQSLKAEVGVDELGNLMYLDLHEKYHGPHGLIAGMTGSGKSEFIITYILAMAMNYSPDDIAFILIDYKGGGLAGAFENKTNNIVLPHLAGTITNLDKAEMDRTLVSIDSEVKRRQKVFNDARDMLGESTIDIYKYQRFFKEGKLTEPVPHLFIICDEFAELKSQQPEFMDNLISVARIGRSLGVHLILATQKPTGVVNDQIWSNTKFRVCLKVQDASDSKEMLKRPEAASLKQTGRFYLQVGYDEYFALGQSGWCGAKYYPSEKIVKQIDKSINFIDDCGVIVKSIQASNGINIEAQGEQLPAIMNSIIEIANKVNKKARRLWLPNISNIIVIDEIMEKYNFKPEPGNIEAIIGEYDAPEKQEQGLVKYNLLDDGNTAVYGTDGSERELLLNAIIYSTTKNYTAEELNYYIIDYGSESLNKWLKLPHVGGVVLQSEEEEYSNLFKMISDELTKRKKILAEYGGEYKNYIKTNKNMPLKVIIINNYDSVYESNQSLYDELPNLIRDSERYGIIFILTAGTSSSISNKIVQNCHNIYAIKLKDAIDYSNVFGCRNKMVPRDIFGRGLVKNDGIHEFQIANITDNVETENDYIAKYINEQNMTNQVKAQIVPVLPEIVRFDHIKDQITGIRSIPVGIEKKGLAVAKMDYLSNLGNIITSNKINNTINFIRSFIYNIKCIPNINLTIVDTTDDLMIDNKGYQNYYNNNFEEVIDNLNKSLQGLIDNKSEIEGILLIYGFKKFVNKITDSKKMQEFTKLIKDYEKISLIVVDDANKIKGFAFETWFTQIFTVNDGIWIGKGISDQNLLHLTKITKQMTLPIKNDMGYVVNESTGALCKLIDYVTKDEGDNNAE